MFDVTFLFEGKNWNVTQGQIQPIRWGGAISVIFG